MDKNKLLVNKIKNKNRYFFNLLIYKLYIYRYDIFCVFLISVILLYFLMPILNKGQIVFSDIAFGFTAKRYIEEIFGTWNERYSTSTLLNTPRLMMILPLYIISSLFDYDATILLKLFVFLLIYMSAFSMYLFSKRLVSIYFSMEFDFYKVFALVTGAVFYALNPWIIVRIQHIYLLCGYALFPVIVMLYFNIFDPRFQKQMISYYKIEKIKIYKRNILDISLFAIIYGIASAAIHYFFFGMIYLGVVSGLMLFKYIILYRKNFNVIKSFIINFIIRVILTGSLFICFSGYWFFSYVGSILLKAQASQHNVNVVDTLAIYSRNSSIENVLYMISYWWPMFNIFDMHWSFYLGGFLIIFIIIYAIIFRGIRHNIILFITVSTLVFFTAATGVKIDLLSDGFIFFVTKVPMIGSMFRDPNKLVGLMAVGYSVLLIIGLQHFYKLLGNKIYHNLIKMFAVCLVIGAFFFYIEPFHKNFIDGFYHPVEIPSEYLEVQNKMFDKESFDSKILYVPIADNMTQSSTGVATPIWNNNNNEDGIDKATGDVHVYTSQKNTIFHHEGNEKNISYFYNYIQYLLDTGKSSNIGTLASAIGVNEFAYHNEYKGQSKRQNFNLQLLEFQKGLKDRFKGEIFSLFEIKDKLKYYSIIPNKIYTTGSFSKLETFSNIEDFNFKDYGVIFKTLKKGIDFSGLEEGDYLESESFDDLVLSNLPEEYFIEPFDFINEGNAFLKWSKTLIQNSDWMWHLRSQGIENNIFDFDFAGGIALTYATSEVDIPSYKIARTKGKIVADFNSLLKMEKFFKPDNPELYDIIANPKTMANSVPLLHGEIVRGNPKNIWQVAKSGMLDAKENNPYKFSILVSGRGSNKMHVKVRFFDEDKNELGMSYVVAPSEEINFNQVKMYGEYVSPKNSKYMRIDLLSYQRPEQKNYWWIHDIKIEDLYKYKKDNIFTMEKSFEKDMDCELFARVFVNKKGGNLKFSFGDKNITIDTFNKSINQFKWVSLGKYSFKEGNNLIEVSNLKGFNSINVLAFIPENEKEELEFPIKKAIEKSKVFQTFEIENDFEYSGNIQSERTYPKLSNGKAISSQNGKLTKDIDILKESKYYFDINMDGVPNLKSSIEIKIINSNEKLVYKKRIYSKDLLKNEDKKIDVVELDYKREYPYYLNKLSETMNHTNKITIKGVYLKKGKHRIVIDYDSKVPSVYSYDDIHKFDPAEINAPSEEVSIYEDPGYTECNPISFDMMKDNKSNNSIKIDYEKTCSIFWYEYASKLLEVNKDDEYLYTFSAMSKGIRKRHTKVLFLDKDKNLVDTVYINEVEEKDKSKWNNYQQIVKVPKNALYMQFHILAKGNKKTEGHFEMKNYSVVLYKNLISLDNMIIFEKYKDKGNFLSNNKMSAKITNIERIDTMKRTFKLYNPYKKRILINAKESPNALWQVNIDDFSSRGTLVLNGVTMGIITESNGDGKMTIVLREIYYIGLIFYALGIIVVIFLNIKFNKK